MRFLDVKAPSSDATAKKGLNSIAATLAICLSYIVTAWFSLPLALPIGYVPAVLPASGIAVCAVYILGPSALVAIAIAALSLNLWITFSAPAVPLAAYLIASITAGASILQGAVGGLLLRRVLGHPCAFDRVREIVLFNVLTPLFCLIGASISIPVLFLFHVFDRMQALQGWLVWWLGDTMGVLLMLPLLLTLFGEPVEIWRRRRVTVALPMLCASVLIMLAFMQAVRWEELESLNYLRTQVGWQSWSFLMFGLLGTALLGAFLLLSSGYTARVELDVREKVAELRESSEKMEALFEISPLGFTLTDLQNHCIECNEAFEKMIGYTAEELKVVDWIALTPPHHQRRTLEHYDRLLKEGRYGPFEKEYRRKDGTLVPVNLNGAIITGKNGQKYLWSIIEDISNRKEAEKALRESEERWQFALEGAGDGIWDIDVVRGDMFLSQQSMAILGYPREACYMAATEWKKYVHPEDLERGRGILRQCIESGESSYIFEFRALTHDGQWRWLRRRAKLLGKLPNGLPARMVGTHTDIHREKHREIKDGLHSMVMEMLAHSSRFVDIMKALTDTLHDTDRDLVYATFVVRQNRLVNISANRFGTELRAREFPWEEEMKSCGNGVSGNEIVHLFADDDSAMCRSFAAFAEDMCIKLCWIEPVRSKSELIKGALVVFKMATDSKTLPDIDHIKHAVELIDAIMEHKRMEEQAQLIASVYEAISEAIVVADEAGRILAVNPAFTTITGYLSEEVIGQMAENLRSIDEGNTSYLHAQKTEDTAGCWKGEMWAHRKNGAMFPIDITINTIWDNNGNAMRRVCIFSDITERKISEERIQYLATHDHLTALPNRTLFQDRVQRALAIAQRENKQFALLYIDLDHFKPVNDELGHSTGDQLLRAVAVRMKTCVRESDTVARVGGDEFVVLLPNIKSSADTFAVAEKITQKLSEEFEINNSVIKISASIGVAIYPEDGTDESELSQHADAAMYRAKQQGRNTIEAYRAMKG